MPVLIAIAVFFLVALLVFMLGWALDQRSAKARLLRERLETVEKTAERKPGEELALVRDEMLADSRRSTTCCAVPSGSLICRHCSPKRIWGYAPAMFWGCVRSARSPLDSRPFS